MKMSSVLNISLTSSSSSIETQKICHICDRTFANGKAMGGHMGAHLTKLPLPLNPQSDRDPSPFIPLLLKGNRDVAVVNPSAHRDASVANPIARQIVLVRSFQHGGGDPRLDLKRSIGESSKSNSVMTDQWPKGVRPKTRVPFSRDCKCPVGESEPAKQMEFNDEDEDEYEDEEEEDNYEDNEDDDVPFMVLRISKSKMNSRGKRMKISKEVEVDRSVGIRRVFRCPYCDKGFSSSQALIGHKKLHLSSLKIGTISKTDEDKSCSV